jgi:hypothetical protein
MATTKNRYRAGRNTDAAQENIEILTGQRGNGLDRALTLRDLASTDLITVTKTSSGNYVICGSMTSDSSNVAIPTTPTGFEVSGGFSSIFLRWDSPVYYGHSHTEIWRGTVESFTDAAMIATTPATVFGDIVSTGSSYYYWVRHVNANNRAGAYNATLGTLGETSRDISEIVDDIAEQMRESALVQWLITGIDDNKELIDSSIAETKELIDTNKATVDEEIAEANQAILDSENALTSSLNQAKAELENAIAELEAYSSSATTENSAQIKQLSEALSQDTLIIAKSLSQLSAAQKAMDAKTSYSLSAEITKVEQVIIDTEQALAEMIVALETAYKADDVVISSSIQTLSQTVASEDGALSTRLDSLESSMSDGDSAVQANLDALSQTVTSADQALSTRIDNLSTSVTTQTGQLNSSIVSLQESTTTADEALAQRIDSLTSQVSDNESSTSASISSLEQSLSDSESATATQFTDLETSLKTADASLSSEIASVSESLSFADKVIAKTVSQLNTAKEIVTNGNQIYAAAQITELQTVMIEADQALAQLITALESSYQSDNNALSSQISTLSQTVSSNNSTTTTAINQLSSTVDDQTASLESLSQTVATIDEDGGTAFQAMWGVKVNVGSISAGIGIMTDSSGNSQVAISANQLFVFDPNTNDSLTPLFAVSDGAVTIPKAFIENATIQIIQAQTITADYVRAGISIETPTITAATINGAEINVGSGGPYSGYHTRITSSGIIYTDYIVASGGSLDNLLIGENCTIKGTLDGADGNFTGTIEANQIVGDVVGRVQKYASRVVTGGNKYDTTLWNTITIVNARSYQRTLFFSVNLTLEVDGDQGGGEESAYECEAEGRIMLTGILGTIYSSSSSFSSENEVTKVITKSFVLTVPSNVTGVINIYVQRLNNATNNDSASVVAIDDGWLAADIFKNSTDLA